MLVDARRIGSPHIIEDFERVAEPAPQTRRSEELRRDDLAALLATLAARELLGWRRSAPANVDLADPVTPAGILETHEVGGEGCG